MKSGEILSNAITYYHNALQYITLPPLGITICDFKFVRLLIGTSAALYIYVRYAYNQITASAEACRSLLRGKIYL